MPGDFDARRLTRRALVVVGLILALVLVAVLAPGLGEVRRRLGDASVPWLLVALALEALSGVSYVLMVKPVFCRTMSWRTSWTLGWSELGMGSLIPASGAGGLALGAWVLRRGGMSADRIARRSVAFYLIKSSVNFVAVVVLGAALAVGVIATDLPLTLTALPAALAVLVIGAVLIVAGRGGEPDPDEASGRVRRWLATAQRAIVRGSSEAVDIVRSGNLLVIGGAFGYWAFDNAVLWATFQAVGASPGLEVVLLGYLIGQLGGLLPVPGGVGGIEGGLIGALIVYGAPAGTTVAAVVAYRLILFWLPLLVGALAFVVLRRDLDRGILGGSPAPAGA